MNVKPLFFKTDVKALKKLMVEKNIRTNTELADKSKVNRVTIGNILNEKEQPSANVMYSLAAALDMTPTQAGLIFFKPNLRIA